MKRLIMITAACLFLAGVASAQIDNYGKTDTIYADVEKLNDQTWTITISLTNDE